MLRLSLISLILLVCAANANLLGTLFGSGTENVVAEKVNPTQPIFSETGLALINSDNTQDASASEGQSSEVIVRAKRYYGCGCGCCGCMAVSPAATMKPCGCGCCGCGYG